MSILTSVFDVIKGWPYGSALQMNFAQKAGLGSDLEEGQVVAVEDASGVPVIDVHTSALESSGNLDLPWLVVRGLESVDGQETNTPACILLRSGVMFRVATAEEVLPNDAIYANAGALTKTDPGGPPLGRVVSYNPVEGWMVVES